MRISAARSSRGRPVPSRRPRRAAVLVAVLVVIAILSLIGYQFFRLMNAEAEAAQAANRLIQTRQLADSGLHYIAFLLAYPNKTFSNDIEGNATLSVAAFYDYHGAGPPLHFVPVPGDVPEAPPRGFFSIVSPRTDPYDELYHSTPYRFGVEDECGKLNLNAILQIDPSGRQAQEVLNNLLMNGLGYDDSALVANIINWARPATSGVEGGDSDADYLPKGAPYESLEELLSVRGMTPRLLLGNDVNRNGIIDPEEGAAGDPIEPGLQHYLTVYSRERNVDSRGMPRINVNVQPNTANEEKWSAVLQKLEADLTDALGDVRMAKMIVAYRIYGPANTGNFNFVPGRIEDFEIDYERADQNTPRNINSLFDLIGSAIEIPQPTPEGQRPRPPIRYMGPWPAANSSELELTLPILLDRCTITDQIELPARVNINTAPRELIGSFPRVTASYLESIMEHRPRGDGTDEAPPEVYNTPTWLITRAGFNPAIVRQFEPYFTTRSQVYRVQSVGYHRLGGPSVRIEAVIDTGYGRPRFLYWRDLSDLGRGYDWRMHPYGLPE